MYKSENIIPVVSIFRDEWVNKLVVYGVTIGAIRVLIRINDRESISFPLYIDDHI